MTAKDIEYYRNMLVEALRRRYNISTFEAMLWIERSTVSQLLKADPFFVMHYDPQYWVGQIHQEQMGY